MASNLAVEAPRFRTPRFVTFAVLAIGLYLASVEYSALNVALPTLARTLHAGEGALALIVDAFGLWQAGLLIPGGAFGDRYGRRRAFTLGLALIAVSAVGAARAGSTVQLVAARSAMGVGAGFEIPVFLATLRGLYPTEAQRRRIAMTYSAVIGVGVATGPALGGWVIARYGIHWVFWGTAALACLGLLLAWAVPPTRDENPQATDPLAAGSTIVGLGALLWGVTEAPANGWTSPRTAVALGGGALCLAAMVWRQRTARDPLIDRGFAGSPRLWAAAGAIAMAYAIVGGTLFALSPQLQVVVGYGPLQGGLRQTPAAAAAIAGTGLALLTERLRWRPAAVATGGFVLIALAELVLARVGPADGYRPLLWAMLLGGLGWGLVTARMTGVIMDILPRSHSSAAAGVDEANRQTALIVGVAMASTLIDVVFRRELAVDGLPPSIAATARSNIAAATQLASRLGRQGVALDAAARAAYVHALDSLAATFAAIAVTVAITVCLVGAASRLTRGLRPCGRHAAASRGSSDHPGSMPDPVRRRERERRMKGLQRPRNVLGLEESLCYDGLSALVDLARDGGGRAIVPTAVSALDRRELEAEGFVFGPATADPLFRRATLPTGWRLALNWEWRRVEVLDGDEIVRAVIAYHPSYAVRRRWAVMTVAIRGRRDPGPSHDGDPVRRSETRWLSGAPRDGLPSRPDGLDRALSFAGLRAIFAVARVEPWALVPRSPAVDEILSRMGFQLGAPLDGDDVFRRVLPPPGWRFDLEPGARAVKVRDADERTRLLIMYSTTAVTGRWAAAIEISPQATPA